MITVIVADTSAVIRSVLKEIILKTKKLEWKGEAASCNELKALIENKKPDVIIADKSLFDAERISALSDYCQTNENPTIIFQQPGERNPYSSKNIKFLDRPEFINFSSEKIQEYAQYLEQQVMDVKCNLLFENHPSSMISPLMGDGSLAAPLQALPKDFAKRKFKAVLVGVSTGGPGALLELLKGLGGDFPLPVFITQHIDSFFDKNLISWLASEAKVPVQLAENNTIPLAGHVYFAPSDEHLTFISGPDGSLRMV